MKPKILWSLGFGLVALLGTVFTAGVYLSTGAESETPPVNQTNQSIDDSGASGND